MGTRAKGQSEGTSPYGHAKYWNYKIAWSRLKEAVEHGFYLEAVTIVESILSDRMLSYLRAVDPERVMPVRSPFASIIGRVKECATGEGKALAEQVDVWRAQRNTLVHGIVRSTPDHPAPDMLDFVALGEEAAWEGARLAKAFSRWQKGEAANRRKATS